MSVTRGSTRRTDESRHARPFTRGSRPLRLCPQVRRITIRRFRALRQSPEHSGTRGARNEKTPTHGSTRQEDRRHRRRGPDRFYLTDHYLDHPWILVRLAKVKPEELRPLLEHAWRMRAPARLLRELDAKSLSGSSSK